MSSIVVLYTCFGHQSPRVPRPGLSSHILDLAFIIASTLKNRGINFHLASTSGESTNGLWNTVYDVLPREHVHILEDETRALTSKISELAKQHDKVIVHLHSMKQVHAYEKVSADLRKKTEAILTLHSFRNALWYAKLWAYLSDFFLTRSSVKKVIVTSDTCLEPFPKLRKKNRLQSIPLCVSLDTEKSEPLPKSVQDLLQKPNCKHLLVPGHFKPGKQQALLLKGLAPWLQQHPDINILFVGNAKDSYTAEIKAIKKQYNLNEQIHHIQPIPRQSMPSLFRACTLGLFPSRNETFGLALVEAILCELPVIATSVGIAPQALQLSPDMLDPTFNVTNWSEKIESIFKYDSVQLSEKCRANKVHMEQLIAPSNIAEQYIHAYNL